MARKLFIDTSILDRVKEDIFEKDWINQKDSDFTIYCHKKIAYQVEDVLKENLSKEVCSKLYYLGSFARYEACPDSDLDLFYLGSKEETLEINKVLRTFFRKYSLKYIPEEGVEFLSREDPFGVLSLHWARAVFDADVEKLRSIRDEVNSEIVLKTKEAIYDDRVSRGKRFGQFPGKLSYNLKNSRGGLKETLQAVWILEQDRKKVDPKVFAQRAFFLKLRSLNHFLGNFDTISLSSANDYLKFFKSESDTEFFKTFFSLAEWGHIFTISVLYPDLIFDNPENFSLKDILNQRNLLERKVPEFLKVKGLVQSPSYHTWAVGEHLIQCVSYMNDIIKEEKENFNLTDFEEDVLLWAALFHDIKKGGRRAHSIAGAEYVNDFGQSRNWDEEKIKLVSWLVREHLTISKFAFSDDPHSDEALKKLYLKGVEKRRAVLLCLLTEADIKATNVVSWSSWKKQILRSLLDRLLHRESSDKEKLKGAVKENGPGFKLAQSLTPTEIASVPYDLLERDLKNFDPLAKHVFYELGDRIWMRFYKEEDEKGIALNLISRLISAGGYVHHAHLKTLKDKKVYDWFCVEAGVSMSAFEKRFHTAKPLIETSKLKFTKIRKTFSGKNRAVVSFKGKDQQGMLLSALYVLTELGLDIRWGHAVTWGEQIEDVFSVEYSTEPDWTKLSEYLSV